MFDALSIGATGMQAQQLHVETIANNIANLNTVGFKKGRVAFSELMVADSQAAAQASSEVTRANALGHASAGVGVAAIAKVFEAGELKKTSNPLDLAIQGDGFLEVTMPDGSTAYTRGGTLSVNKDGLLANAAGWPLKPAIAIPANVQSITINAEGRVLLSVPNQSTTTDAGQLQLVRFPNTASLVAEGSGVYRARDAAGDPISARPGEDGSGTLAQGFVETSNVKMVDEFVNLMLAQRAYEASVKVVQAADEMLGMVNNLRK